MDKSIVIHYYNYINCYAMWFSDTKFVELLRYHFDRSKHHGELSDIYDGEIYKECGKFFDNPFNLSLTLNYDGAPKSKLMINELPPFTR